MNKTPILWASLTHNLIGLCFLSLLTPLTAQAQNGNWPSYVRRLTTEQLHSVAVRQTAQTVMAHQTPVGGWPKNLFYPALSADDVSHWNNIRQQGTDALNFQATIDNNATTLEIHFLLQLARAQAERTPFTDSLTTSALKGVEYLLCMQYSNGGFPQYWPRADHYHAAITFNDNAMINALQLLIDFASSRPPFDFVPADTAQASIVSLMRKRAFQAGQLGVRCILDTQLQDSLDQKAVWCQQYDAVSLAPCAARAYELPSFCTSESLQIMRFLRRCMDDPLFREPKLFKHAEIREAIAAAERWLEGHALTGIRKEYFHNAQGQRDYHIAPCLPHEQCPRLWARFYDLHTERPIFVDRDGIPHSRIEAIGHERRNGYAWFNSEFDAYKHEFGLK